MSRGGGAGAAQTRQIAQPDARDFGINHLARSVGIRELRQNLSRYVARTLRGESFEVTERGRPVGRLVPVTTGEPWLDELVADGRVRPAERRSAVLPEPRERGSGSIAEALEAEREERLP